MKQITVQEGQSWFDIAMQYYGFMEGIAYLLEDINNYVHEQNQLRSNLEPLQELDINTELEAGQILLIRDKASEKKGLNINDVTVRLFENNAQFVNNSDFMDLLDKEEEDDEE
ncbi:hypothetical protein [Xanthovirga aplysinae]|uniref:hypothetical protein n=1 Tax=Xanthovirga aplysinae TaxID=2529853 RepID=UPI0012BC5E03|nr:hypothetical protein [Xanthovirga aplysinae]MTI33158.1 hypothetical protein [Xanthovirga aplysinae]